MRRGDQKGVAILHASGSGEKHSTFKTTALPLNACLADIDPEHGSESCIPVLINSGRQVCHAIGPPNGFSYSEIRGDERIVFHISGVLYVDIIKGPVSDKCSPSAKPRLVPFEAIQYWITR